MHEIGKSIGLNDNLLHKSLVIEASLLPTSDPPYPSASNTGLFVSILRGSVWGFQDRPGTNIGKTPKKPVLLQVAARERAQDELRALKETILNAITSA